MCPRTQPHFTTYTRGEPVLRGHPKRHIWSHAVHQNISLLSCCVAPSSQWKSSKWKRIKTFRKVTKVARLTGLLKSYISCNNCWKTLQWNYLQVVQGVPLIQWSWIINLVMYLSHLYSCKWPQYTSWVTQFLWCTTSLLSGVSKHTFTSFPNT